MDMAINNQTKPFRTSSKSNLNWGDQVELNKADADASCFYVCLMMQEKVAAERVTKTNC